MTEKSPLRTARASPLTAAREEFLREARLAVLTMTGEVVPKNDEGVFHNEDRGSLP